ncbi:hypothetical protein Tco_1381061 [Tanacetum coccineum]
MDHIPIEGWMMMENKRYGELIMIDNHLMDKLLKEVLMIDCLCIVETEKVIHSVKTDIVKLVVEIESFDMSSDKFDKETGSSDGLQPKQADLSCVHALNKLHLHEIHVVPTGIKLSKEQLAILADIGERVDSGADALAEVHNPDNMDKNMINHGVQVKPSSEQSSVVNHSETEITSDSNIIPYSQYVTESQQTAVQNSNLSAQQDALILSVIEQLKSQVINCTKINLDNKSVNDSLTAELERYKEQVKVLKEGQNVDLKTLAFQNPFYLKKAQQLEPKLYDGNVIKNTSAIVIPNSEDTFMLAEESRSKMLLKQQDPMMLEKEVNTTPVDYAVFNQLSQDFETRFVPQTKLSVEQAFWSHNSDEQIVFHKPKSDNLNGGTNS